MSRLRLFLLVAFLCCAASALAAAVSGPQVGHAPGLLGALPAASKPGYVCATGQAVPEDCPLVSAGAGPSLVELPQGSVQAAADSRLRIKAGGEKIALQSGRVFVQARRVVELGGGGLRIRLGGGCRVELAVVDDGNVEAYVPPGAALQIRGGEVIVQEAGQGDAGNLIVWRAKAAAGERLKVLSLLPKHQEERQKQLDGWTSLAKPVQGLGQLVVKDSQLGSPVRLNVARYHAHVVLQPPVALVQIDQSFYNPYDRQEEGTFVFSLPRGASVSRFAMYVTPEQLVEGELVKRQRASEVYETIVARQRDPAILEQIGDNLFKMRVFPIFPKDVKRILLDYTVPLESIGGAGDFRLPLFSDLEPIWDFRLSGVISADAQPAGAASLSHPAMKFHECVDKAISFELAEQDYRPTSDFLLSFRQAAGRQPTVRSFTTVSLASPEMNAQERADPWLNQEAMYFQATVPADLRDAGVTGDGHEKKPELPADVLLLADTSSSMRGCKLMGPAVHMVLRSLQAEDRFRLICVDVGARPLGDGWQPGGGAAVEAALAEYDKQVCLGGTDLSKGLREAVAAFDAGATGRRRIVVYIGDGENTLGRERELGNELARCVRDARASFFAVIADYGKRPEQPQQGFNAAGAATPATAEAASGRNLMESVARDSGGLVFNLVGASLGQHDLLAWLLAGLPQPMKIAKVDVEGADAEDLYFPTAWLAGRNLDVLGRVTPRNKLRLTLTTIHDGKPVTQHWELNVPRGQDDVLVGRQWAQRKLDHLRRQETPAEGSIIALSQEWSLLSPYTAFLVLENEQAYTQWQFNRRQRHRYWKRQDAESEPLFSSYWAARAAEHMQAAGRLPPQLIMARALRAARLAIEEGHPSLAVRLLASVPKAAQADKSPEYAEMRRRATAGVERETLLRAIEPYRALMDPSLQAASPPLQPRVFPLVATAAAVDPEFVRRHPYSQQLLRLVDVAAQRAKPAAGRVTAVAGEKSNKEPRQSVDPWDPFDTARDAPGQRTRRDGQISNWAARATRRPAGKRTTDKIGQGGPTVEELAALLGNDASMNVVLDRRALADAGIAADEPIDSYGRGQLSLRSYARFLLAQVGLTLQEEPHRLLITTEEEADQRITTEIYPVDDLLATDRVAECGLLSDPYMDREEAARVRIGAKLRRPTHIAFNGKPLREVVDELAKTLDDTVLVDAKAMRDAGMHLDIPVTAVWRNVPVRESLQWILHDFSLTYIVRGEALVITTQEEADNKPETRLHSGRGVLFEYPMIRDDGIAPGMGAAGWGMGSMRGGMGGMMGGIGGMMGGMGGGMGGMAGGGTFGGPAGADAAAAGMSSGGDAGAVEEPQGDAAAAQPTDSHERPVAGARPSELSVSVWQQQFQYDIDSVVDMITSTVKPTTWAGVGGPGSLCLFEPTLDFVIDTTDEVHREIDVLLGRLRRLPAMSHPRCGGRPATVHPSDADDGWDFDSMINMITSTVRPTTWDGVGGPGSVAPDEPRAALIVSQDQEVHDALRRLLVMLRRSRYVSLRPDRPWQFVPPSAARPLAASWAQGNEQPVALSALPEPKAEELAALRVRHVPESATWEWTRLMPDRTWYSIRVRRQGGRLEIVLPECVLRADGDTGAIAWPGLGLVELGNWGEMVRQVADRVLPWLPHRTNEELARLFEVSKAEGGRLRLIPAGVPASAKTWLEVEVAEKSELPRFWQSHLAGKLAGQLRVGKSSDVAGHAVTGPNEVWLEDGDGKRLASWKTAKTQQERLPGRPIPALDADWNGYVRLDWRWQRPAVDRAVREAIEAIGKSDLAAAADRLTEARKQQPRHPLLLLLTAWCYEHEVGAGHRAQVPALLREVVDGRRPLLRQFIAEGNFRSLTAAELYAIISRPVEEPRDAAECDSLARLAIETGNLEAALQHARAALSAGEPSGRFARQFLVVDLLLRLEQAAEAAAMAKRWATEAEPSAEQSAAVAELLAKYGRTKIADELLARALDAKRLSAEQRFDLTYRRAFINEGQRRWRLLLEAAAIVPADSPGRNLCLKTIFADLNEPSQAEAAGQLAARTDDPRLKWGLLLRQADLTENLEVVADLDWQVYKAGQLPADRVAAACGIWNAANLPQHVVEAAEARLRSGKAISSQMAEELVNAYRSVGRDHDAQRAASSDPEPPAPEPAATQHNRRRSAGLF